MLSTNLMKYIAKCNFSYEFNLKHEQIFKKEKERRQKEQNLINEKYQILCGGLLNFIKKIIDFDNIDTLITEIIDLSIEDMKIAEKHRYKKLDSP